jgi:hypothetical protein
MSVLVNTGRSITTVPTELSPSFFACGSSRQGRNNVAQRTQKAALTWSNRRLTRLMGPLGMVGPLTQNLSWETIPKPKYCHLMFVH